MQTAKLIATNGKKTNSRKIKKLLGWLHLWLGLAAGIVILVVAITGSLLAFESELELILFKERHVVAANKLSRLPADSSFAIAQQAYPGKKISRLIIEPEPNRSVEVRLGTKGEKLNVVYLNPYQGNILYKGSYNKQFFQQVRNLHRYLLLGDTGKIITGISCAICFFLVISGLVLWWPANQKAIKQRFKIKWDASGKRLNWDLHAVTGFYVSIFLLLITLTGLVWSYDWINNLIFKIADGKPQKKELKVANVNINGKLQAGVYERMYQEMNKNYPYPGKLSFNIPPQKEQAVMLQKEPINSVSRQIDAAYFDRNSGILIKKIPFANLSTGTKIRRMILPVHSGSLFGWPTKLLAFFVAVFTASLPVSGMLLWTGRRRKKGHKNSSVLV